MSTFLTWCSTIRRALAISLLVGGVGAAGGARAAVPQGKPKVAEVARRAGRLVQLRQGRFGRAIRSVAKDADGLAVLEACAGNLAAQNDRHTTTARTAALARGVRHWSKTNRRRMAEEHRGKPVAKEETAAEKALVGALAVLDTLANAPAVQAGDPDVSLQLALATAEAVKAPESLRYSRRNVVLQPVRVKLFHHTAGLFGSGEAFSWPGAASGAHAIRDVAELIEALGRLGALYNWYDSDTNTNGDTALRGAQTFLRQRLRAAGGATGTGPRPAELEMLRDKLQLWEEAQAAAEW